MGSERDDLIILIDEDGNEVEAEYIDTIEYRDNEYVVLLPRDEHEHSDEDCDCGEEEVVILKVEHGEGDDDDSFVAIEDEDEQDAVFEIFTQRMEEVDFVEDDEDDDAPGDSDKDTK